MEIEDDDESLECLYQDGHWEWDNKSQQLEFLREIDESSDFVLPPISITIGDLEFKDDMDLLDEQRFRKKYQRKTKENDVITLQDVKDLAIYVTPMSILTTTIVNILHLPATERFIRALILYCQYYFQVAAELSRRTTELNSKVKTSMSDKIVSDLRENMEDLRLLVAKEYSFMILAGGEYRPYHHMGLNKTKKSLSMKECIIFESLLRICIQIIWLALGRKHFNQIYTEVNRLFKSSSFNNFERKLNPETQISENNQLVLRGQCMKTSRLPYTTSPLMNEVFCDRLVNFRMFALGVIKYPELTPRLRYLEQCLVAPEAQFPEMGISLGIIGHPRSRYDTMLREIKFVNTGTSTSQVSGRISFGRISARLSRVSRKSVIKEYPDIIIPDTIFTGKEYAPMEFPDQTYPFKHCNEVQRKKWIARVRHRRQRKNVSLKSKVSSSSKNPGSLIS